VGSNPTGAWTFVSCECCVLSGRGLCDELITRPEESSYQLCCVLVCDLETSWRRRPWPIGGCRAQNKHLLQKNWQCRQLTGRFFFEIRLVLQMQRNFRAKCRKTPPHRPSIRVCGIWISRRLQCALRDSFRARKLNTKHFRTLDPNILTIRLPRDTEGIHTRHFSFNK